jgi:hypothetical protein
MSPYEQKTDSREFEVANPGGLAMVTRRTDMPAVDTHVDPTDIAIRLWGSQALAHGASSGWRGDSVLIYMIADLVYASAGRVADESPEILGAHFDGFRQALVAAKRIQTSILEFLACRPGERIGSAIVIYQSQSAAASGFSPETVRWALRQAKPGQILLADSISKRLGEIPGTEVRTIPALTTVAADEQTGLAELLWTTPDRVALAQSSVGDDAESQADDIPSVGATVIVHSPFARKGPTAEAAPPVTASSEMVNKSGSESGWQQRIPVNNNPPDRVPGFENLRDSPGNSLAEGLEQFSGRPLVTRTRAILGVLALVLVAALIAVLYRPSPVSRVPIRMQHGTAAGPEKQAPANAEPEAKTAQPEAEPLKPEPVKGEDLTAEAIKQPITKSRAKATRANVQSQTASRSDADSRGKSQKDAIEVPTSYPEEFGGVSQKDIPALLKMAQGDAGAGSYDKARTEFLKILRLQPNNQDAKEGLRKLDLIPKDQR